MNDPCVLLVLRPEKHRANVQGLQGRFAPWAEAQGLPSQIHSTGFTPGLKPRPFKEKCTELPGRETR